MHKRLTQLMATLGVLALGATAPVVAQARHGSDDPVGHHRHAKHERHHGKHHHHHRGHHHRHGADDGPNHT